ncbi:hypothetical protein Clacol_000477 [Clathrus columnatus]|uniref:Queuosine 5'-phosphate N-glycosylase/hydrolase n=1 Tax=Clathrus columnatus TaxID=1419009 RepID=A0AAV4ZWL0_9AGAM|nr:hypothetical protein Clacol_000477 [Clathrus columnatus]
MSSPITFPAAANYLSSIRETAKTARESHGIKISSEAIRAFLHSPALQDTFSPLSTAHGLAFPLNFPSSLSELNLISILSLINFGSGYRVPLHKAAGRGAWDTIRAFGLSSFVSSMTESGEDNLSARALKEMSVTRVAALMNVSVHVESPHPTLPGVTIGEIGGPLHEFVQLVSGVLTSTGEILVDRGYPDLGSFMLETLKEAERFGEGKGVDVDFLLDKDLGYAQLVRALPAFRDMAIVDGQHNVIPSILVHLRILDLSTAHSPSLKKAFNSSLSLSNIDVLLSASPDKDFTSEEKRLIRDRARTRIPEEGPVLSSDDAYILRAAAIDACEEIVKIAATDETLPDQIKQMTLPELDAWLWAGAKDRSDYRELVRFVERNTIFF